MNSRRLETYLTQVNNARLCLKTAEVQVRFPAIAVQALRDLRNSLNTVRRDILTDKSVAERKP